VNFDYTIISKFDLLKICTILKIILETLVLKSSNLNFLFYFNIFILIIC